MAAQETIEIRITAATKQFEKGIRSARQAVNKFGPAAVGAATTAAAAFLSLSQRVADATNALNDAATRTGVSARTLAGLKLAAEGAGLGLSDMEAALRPFPKRLADAGRGTGEALVAFKALGVNVKDADGNLRSADDVLAEVTGKMQRVKSPTERAALATAAFGEAGGALLQALGGQELEDFTDKAETFGVDVGPGASDAASEWQRSMADLKLVIEGTVAAMVPLETATNTLKSFTLGLTFLVAKTKALAQGHSAAEAHTIALNTAMEFHATQVRDTSADTEALTVDVSALTASQTDAAEAAKRHAEALREEAKAQQEASQAFDAFVALSRQLRAEADPVQAVKQQQRERLKVIADALNREAITEAEAQRLRVRVHEAANAEIMQLREEHADETKEAVEELASFEVETGLEKSIRLREQAEQVQANVARSAVAVLDSATSFTDGLLQDQIDMWASFGAVGRDEAKKLFAVQKAINLSNAVVSTAAAVTMALATPPGPPITTPFAVAAGIMGALQIATIAAEQPSFHIGSRAGDLAPDEVQTAIATRREAVVSPQGIEAIANANAGAMGGGGSFVIQMGHDYFDAQMMQANRRPGPVRSGRGSRVGHRKRKTRTG